LTSDFFPPTLGGVERHVYTLAKYLDDIGFKVDVLTENIEENEVDKTINLKLIRDLYLFINFIRVCVRACSTLIGIHLMIFADLFPMRKSPSNGESMFNNGCGGSDFAKLC
jgi:glycosyltransferase involved in cell wall biosynthesis